MHIANYQSFEESLSHSDDSSVYCKLPNIFVFEAML